jgi:hypothetical protein
MADQSTEPTIVKVQITSINIPFIPLVKLLLKIGVASIPVYVLVVVASIFFSMWYLGLARMITDLKK